MDDVRARFSRVLRRDEIYLANHSLGRPLDQTADDIREAVDLWYADMDAAWDAWLDEMKRWRANLARLLGISRPDAIVPKTSAGQGLRAVLNAFPQDRPVRVVATTGEFDSIDFILKAYSNAGRIDLTWVEPCVGKPIPIYTAQSLKDALADAGAPAGLVVISLAFFGTAQILAGAEDLVAAAHERGWLVLLDVYHAAGVIPLDLESMGADFAIGGSYKYLRGGPGACYLALRSPDSPLRTLDTGWFAKKDTFDYARASHAEFKDGGDGWLESTPPILMPYQARAGLELMLEIGVERLRAESLAQQSSMREAFCTHGVKVFEPDYPELFGAFSLLRHPSAAAFSSELRRRGVNTDARGEFVRFGPDLLNTDEEIERAAKIVAGVIRA